MRRKCPKELLFYRLGSFIYYLFTCLKVFFLGFGSGLFTRLYYFGYFDYKNTANLSSFLVILVVKMSSYANAAAIINILCPEWVISRRDNINWL